MDDNPFVAALQILVAFCLLVVQGCIWSVLVSMMLSIVLFLLHAVGVPIPIHVVWGRY